MKTVRMFDYLAYQKISKYKVSGIIIVMMLFAVLITFIRWYAVVDTIRSYARAFDVYEPDHSLFLWIGQREFLFANRATTLSSIAKFISDFLPLLAIPLLLILFGTDSYFKDRRAGLIQVICTKEKKHKYVFSQLIFCFMLTFLIIAAFLLVQLVISMVVNRTIVIHRLPVIDQMPYTVFEYISATFRIGLYYAALSAVAYAVSLFIYGFRTGASKLEVLLVLCYGDAAYYGHIDRN